MSDIKKARFFLRRGNDVDRLLTTFCEGELAYSLDGKRVFAGDSETLGGNAVGQKLFLIETGTNKTSLTAASGNGLAEVGDLVFTTALTYSLSDFHADISVGDTHTPNEQFGTMFAVSARDANTNELTFVALNSAIPLSHIDIPDNSISFAKLHGGEASGNVLFTTSLSAANLSATNLSSYNAVLTNDINATDTTGFSANYLENRPVLITKDGLLKSTDTSTASHPLVHTKLYIDRIRLGTITKVTGTDITPETNNANWTVFDVSSYLDNTGIKPKAAIVSIYTSYTGDRVRTALFSSYSVTGTYSDKFYVLGCFGVGEDAGGDADINAFGGVYSVRLPYNTHNLILQIKNFAGDASMDVYVDLIGYEY
jgi:hypothetical protein